MKISLDTLKSLDVYRKNSALYNEVIKNNQALVNSEGGCLVYFYSLPAMIWKGYKLGPMMGHGNKEVWKLVKNHWRCCFSKMTWVS